MADATVQPAVAQVLLARELVVRYDGEPRKGNSHPNAVLVSRNGNVVLSSNGQLVLIAKATSNGLL